MRSGKTQRRVGDHALALRRDERFFTGHGGAEAMMTGGGSAALALEDVPLRPGAREPRHGAFVGLFERRAWTGVRLLVDTIALYVASASAVLAFSVAPDGRWIAMAFPVVALAILHTRQSPDERLRGSAVDTAVHMLGVVSVGTIVTIGGASILGDHQHLGQLALGLWLFAGASLGIARVGLLLARKRAFRRAMIATPTLIVGAGVVGDQVARRLNQDHRYGLRPVGMLDADPLPSPGRSRTRPAPVLGAPTDLVDAIHKTAARHVILAFTAEPDSTLVARIRECQELGVGVSLVPRLYESISERSTLDHVGGLPLISLRPTNTRSWQFAVKHALDRVVAAFALLAFGPLMLAIASGIRLTSPGPALFRQRRVGRDGRVFDVLKFRTMRLSRDSEEFTPPEGCAPGGVEGEDRRTPLGKWLRNASLDELPQLINVLRGDMSLVGPRPERPEFVRRFRGEVNRYDDRHRVKSGITGWAQVNGLRGQTSIADRIEWDNHYIQNWSPRMDLRIIVLTVLEVIRCVRYGHAA